MKSKVSEFENNEKLTRDTKYITGGHPWCRHSSSSTRSSSQPGGISPGETTPERNNYSNAEYTNTQQDLTIGDNYITKL
jgi:hypothetical protein